MNPETQSILEESTRIMEAKGASDASPEATGIAAALEDFEAIFSDKDKRKGIVVHTAKSIVRSHKATMELLADK